MMLNYPVEWLINNMGLLEKKEIKIAEQVRSPDNIESPFFRVDLENLLRIARFCLWISGECDIEVLDVESEKYILWEHYEIVNYDDIEYAFFKILEKMQ